MENNTAIKKDPRSRWGNPAGQLSASWQGAGAFCKKYRDAPADPVPSPGSCKNTRTLATISPIVTTGRRRVGFASEIGMRLNIMGEYRFRLAGKEGPCATTSGEW